MKTFLGQREFTEQWSFEYQEVTADTTYGDT